MSIESTFAAIPSQTCTRRSGTSTSRLPSHVESCARCAGIRAAMLAVLEEVAEILDDGLDDGPSKPVITYLLSGVRDEIAALAPPDGQEPPREEG